MPSRPRDEKRKKKEKKKKNNKEGKHEYKVQGQNETNVLDTQEKHDVLL